MISRRNEPGEAADQHLVLQNLRERVEAESQPLGWPGAGHSCRRGAGGRTPDGGRQWVATRRPGLNGQQS